MKLKKLVVMGFKSFADKVTLLFNPGMTAIVGPNGCGKSNISDSIRWVMGEQSAKSMRGGKMPDIIFNGTAHRKPVNVAEVSLTFSEINGALPVDYEEVEIKRRLHRSGESDYFINGHQVRLKDIQSMLWGTGVGHQAFCIFEQGKIDQVIQYSPTERVQIFVEAAGIVRFLHRKKETMKKLQDVDNNLTRINDIHREVTKRIDLLKEQAERAIHFKEIKSNLVELEKTVFTEKIKALDLKLQQLTATKDNLARELQEKAGAFAAGENQKNRLKEELTHLEKAFHSKNEEVYRARGTKQLKDQEQKNHKERHKEASEKEKQCLKELEEIAEQRKKRQQELNTLQKELKKFEEEKNSFEERLGTVQNAYQSLEKEAGHLREKQLKTQHERLKLTQLESQIESEIKQKGVRQEHLQEKQSQLKDKRKRALETIAHCNKVVEEKKASMKQAEAVVDQHRTAFQHLDQQLNHLVKELENGQKKWEDLHKEQAEQQARYKVLSRLKEEMQGFSSGAKMLAQESLKEKSPIYGKLKPLYECLTPQSGAEEALAIVMKPYMQTMVVASAKDFDEVQAFAQSKKLTDYSLLCMAYLEEAGIPVNAPKNAKSLKEMTSHHPLSNHFLSKAYITEHLSHALDTIKAQAGAEVWTKQGVYVDRNKVIFYPGQGEQNIFTREAELKELEKSLKKLEGEARRLEELIQNLKKQRIDLQNQRAEADKAVRKEEMKLVEANFGLQKANGDVEKAKSEIPLIDKEGENLEIAVKDISSQIEALTKKHSTAKNQLSDVQQEAQGAEVLLEKQLKALRESRQHVQSEESTYQKISSDLGQRKHAINLIEIKEQESTIREKRLHEDLKHMQNLQTTLTQKTAQETQDLEEIEKVLKTASTECEKMEKELQFLKEKVQQFEEKLQQGKIDHKEKEGKLNQYQVQLTQLEGNRQTILEELTETHQLTFEEAQKVVQPLSLPLDQAEKKLKQFRHEVDGAGDINFAAIEELEKHEERSKFFDQEVGDMNKTKHELMAIIAELDGQSRTMFHKTFEEIREHFKRNFRVLFEGGEADLELVDAEDIMEAGIEISAKPPGKQMRSIQLLSGGEKCLTAMALLFAIFEVKPSPFCILDEIDAPLDDTNVERFARIVQQYADRCQFIVITHNKRTMAIADTLFGVSMEEKGVSKILTLAFSQAQAHQVSIV